MLTEAMRLNLEKYFNLITYYVTLSLVVLTDKYTCSVLPAFPTDLVPVHTQGTITNVDYSFSAQRRHQKWTETAYDFIRNTQCKQVTFTSNKECRKLGRVKKSEMNVFIADPTVKGKLEGVLPDGSLRRAGAHDGLVAIDPYPHAEFGHLIIVFFVDLEYTREGCSAIGGVYMGTDGCLQLALKRRCRNLLERRGRRRSFGRRCEINFIPFVYIENDPSRDQRLVCRSDIAGFSACPVLRPKNETSQIVCDALRENTKRCETSHETVHTSCRVFEICDQAVILSGGFNRLGSQRRHKKNIWHVYNMLRTNGFLKRNIKVFFANGLKEGIRVDGESAHEVLPSAMKHAFRIHIRKICDSPHCADSLVLYMNSPAQNDGTSLLWDLNADGIADVNEVYTKDELLSDLANCQARQVHVIADQSYSGELARYFRRSSAHPNVAVYASSRDNEYSYNSEFTRQWTTANHTHKCMYDMFKEIKHNVKSSKPELGQGRGVSKVTLYGAPCDVRPPYTHRELSQKFLGCQNVPTASWIRVLKYLQQQQNSDRSVYTYNGRPVLGLTNRDQNTSGRIS